MVRTTKHFLECMLTFFPSAHNEWMEHIEQYGEVLENVVIEDIFQYFEETALYGNKQLIDNFSVTVLEILGNDRKILETAKKYMGAKTMQLQLEADMALGRI